MSQQIKPQGAEAGSWNFSMQRVANQNCRLARQRIEEILSKSQGYVEQWFWERTEHLDPRVALKILQTASVTVDKQPTRQVVSFTFEGLNLNEGEMAAICTEFDENSPFQYVWEPDGPEEADENQV